MQIQDSFPGVELSFFAANSSLFHELVLDQSGRFGIHDESKYKIRHARFLQNNFGSLTIDLKENDAVIMVGRNTRETDIISRFGTYAVDGVRDLPDRPRLSRAAFDDFARSIFETRRLGPEWRHWDQSHLFVLPPPAPRQAPPADMERYAPWAAFEKQAVNNIEFLNAYRDLVAKDLSDDGITLLHPPPEVVASTGLTLTQFSGNAEKLPAGTSASSRLKAAVKGAVSNNSDNTLYPEDDFHHMNAQYGAIVLRHVLNNILDF